VSLGLVALFAVACGLGEAGPTFGDLCQPAIANPRPLRLPEQGRDETFVAPAPWDLLWVVDDGPAMEAVQAELAAQLPAFVTRLATFDVHLAVVPADPARATLSGWVAAADPGAGAFLADSVRLGTDGPAVPAPLDALTVALGSDSVGFLREGAGLTVVVVTTQDDPSAESFVEPFLAAAPAAPGRVLSVLGDPAASSGLFAASAATGGLALDVGQPDWALALSDLADAANGLQDEFFLSRWPNPDTVHLQVFCPGGAVFEFDGSDYDYDPVQNSVTFLEYLPEPGSTVVVEYELPAGAPIEQWGGGSPCW
jgi:hypothetical protein